MQTRGKALSSNSHRGDGISSNMGQSRRQLAGRKGGQRQVLELAWPTGRLASKDTHSDNVANSRRSQAQPP